MVKGGKKMAVESDASRHARTYSDGNNSYGPPNGERKMYLVFYFSFFFLIHAIITLFVVLTVSPSHELFTLKQ